MATLRSGTYGNYYGSQWGTSQPLTQSEMEVNAKYIFSYLTAKGWTKNSICALLGNLQAESSINPGRWQSDNVGSTSNGYGLVQWTPSTKYTEWCTTQGYSDPSEMDNNLKRIIYEVDNGLQWISTNTYSLSFKEFTSSVMSVSDLAKAFLLNYERPKDQSEPVQNYRSELASNWYTYLTGVNPSQPSNPSNRRKRRYKFVLYKRRNNQYGKARIY